MLSKLDKIIFGFFTIASAMMAVFIAIIPFFQYKTYYIFIAPNGTSYTITTSEANALILNNITWIKSIITHPTYASQANMYMVIIFIAISALGAYSLISDYKERRNIK